MGVCFLVQDEAALEFCRPGGAGGWAEKFIEGTFYTVNRSVGAEHVVCG